MAEATVETMDLDPATAEEGRTPFQVLSDTRTAVEEIVEKMVMMMMLNKRESSSKSDLRELITQTSLHFLTLRQVNRAILLEEDRVKSEMENARAPVDLASVQLYNLLYEKNHYLKAIKACKDFKTGYPDIDLAPEEEFFANAPEDIKRNAAVLELDDGAHDLMLKRLNYELLQRKKLCKLGEKLEQCKKRLLDNIAARKKFLSSLPSHLKVLKKVTLPMQPQLGMPHSKNLKQQRAAELLPPPLYIVYSQLLAQKEDFAEKIDMEIIGSMKEAQAFALQQSNMDHGMSINMETNITEDKSNDKDDNQRGWKRPKKVPSKDGVDEVEIYQSHPLNVVVHILDDEEYVAGAIPLKLLTLRFEYLVMLNAVCVGLEVSDEGSMNISLSNIFPDDDGTQLPHQAAKVCVGEEEIVFDEERSCRPYKWAQHLAGMDFLADLPPSLRYYESSKNEFPKDVPVMSGLSLYRQQNRVETLLQRIRSLTKAQVEVVPPPH